MAGAVENYDQLQSDEELAARLQQEEVANFPGGVEGLEAAGDGYAVPLLERFRPGQQAEVNRNVVGAVNNAQENSPRLFALSMILAVLEVLATVIVLGVTWDLPCDRPLREWAALYSGRWLLLVPLTCRRYRVRRRGQLGEFETKVKTWVNFGTFVWFIFGQTWVYDAETCANTNPTLYQYCLVLIVLLYVGMAMPLILLIGLCVCLPVVLLVLRCLAGSPGASDTTIRDLPTRTFGSEQKDGGGRGGAGEGGKDPDSTGSNSSTEGKEDFSETRPLAPENTSKDPAAADTSNSAPSCAICMDDFKIGDELRLLPCKHEFHITCVDRWLALNSSCPMCRGSIVKGRRGGSDENV